MGWRFEGVWVFQGVEAVGSLFLLELSWGKHWGVVVSSEELV